MSKAPSRAVPLDTLPDLLALHRHDPERYPFLLESAASGGTDKHALGRYDILFCKPGDEIVLTAADIRADCVSDFLGALDNAIAAEGGETVVDDLPFRGGWFVFLGYEMAAEVEPSLRLPFDDKFPVAFAVRVTTAIVVNRESGRAWLVSETGDDGDVMADLSHTLAAVASTSMTLVDELQEEPPQHYLDAVDEVRQHIVDGDVFQVNLSRLWRAQLKENVSDVDVYANLRATNPAPFAGLVRWRDSSIISSSPERLVRLRDGVIETRPIAGTRPRGQGSDEDQALSAELLRHPKERAEHVMLIDLERNDLGRVSVPGSVHVDELMAIETYAHVHHIVSNVSGRLRSGVTPGQALRAVFPGGTITGCPKVRCMQIIADLEGQARGPYTGAVGYLNRNGSGDFNILIRTLVRHGRQLELRAGAGIVADSEPARELEETRAKAHGLLIALNADAVV